MNIENKTGYENNVRTIYGANSDFYNGFST
jgi:hypothetical protein